eukprot:8365382-Heterocapsa_arctica.AAC.1
MGSGCCRLPWSVCCWARVPACGCLPLIGCACSAWRRVFPLAFRCGLVRLSRSRASVVVLRVL